MGRCILLTKLNKKKSIHVDILRQAGSGSYSITTEKEYDTIIAYVSGFTGGGAGISGATSSGIDVWKQSAFISNHEYDAGHWCCSAYYGTANKGHKIPIGAKINMSGAGSGGSVCYGIYYE